MTTVVKPIPDGYRAATPYLCVSDASASWSGLYHNVFSSAILYFIYET